MNYFYTGYMIKERQKAEVDELQRRRALEKGSISSENHLLTFDNRLHLFDILLYSRKFRKSVLPAEDLDTFHSCFKLK